MLIEAKKVPIIDNHSSGYLGMASSLSGLLTEV